MGTYNVGMQNKCAQKTDEQLVELALLDVNYFECIVLRYQEKLNRYIKFISNLSAFDRDDVLQNVFIKVYAALNSFDKDLKFSSWIYRICRNETVSYIRHLKSSADSKCIECDDDEIKEIASDFDLVGHIDKKMMKEKVSKALVDLPMKYREVISLFFIEGRDYTEISDILKKPMGTIATLLHRAKKEFKISINKQNI